MSDFPYTRGIIEKVEKEILKKLAESLPPQTSPDFQAGFNFSKELMLKTIAETKSNLL